MSKAGSFIVAFINNLIDDRGATNEITSKNFIYIFSNMKKIFETEFDLVEKCKLIIINLNIGWGAHLRVFVCPTRKTMNFAKSIEPVCSVYLT